MRLIDADQLKKEWSMGDICETCVQDTRQCGNDYCFSRMDVCGMIDDAPTIGGWISVKDRLPEQTPSLFSKFKDTDKWSKAMWVMDSETVLVTVAAKGESIVTTGKLQDGKWCTRISPVIEYKVTHWMPLPEPPKEDIP